MPLLLQLSYTLANIREALKPLINTNHSPCTVTEVHNIEERKGMWPYLYSWFTLSPSLALYTPYWTLQCDTPAWRTTEKASLLFYSGHLSPPQAWIVMISLPLLSLLTLSYLVCQQVLLILPLKYLLSQTPCRGMLKRATLVGFHTFGLSLHCYILDNTLNCPKSILFPVNKPIGSQGLPEFCASLTNAPVQRLSCNQTVWLCYLLLMKAFSFL